MTSRLRPSMRTSWKRIRNWIPNTIIWLYGGTDRPFRCRLFKQEHPLLFLIGSILTRFKRVFWQRRRAWLRNRYTWWASINDFAVDLTAAGQNGQRGQKNGRRDEQKRHNTKHQSLLTRTDMLFWVAYSLPLAWVASLTMISIMTKWNRIAWS